MTTTKIIFKLLIYTLHQYNIFNITSPYSRKTNKSDRICVSWTAWSMKTKQTYVMYSSVHPVITGLVHWLLLLYSITESNNKCNDLNDLIVLLVFTGWYNVFCFVLAGIVIVVLSSLIMYYNIGLPNSLRGFLFYSQVNNMCEVAMVMYSYLLVLWLENWCELMSMG